MDLSKQIRKIIQVNQSGDEMIGEMEYKKGNYVARMVVLDTGEQRFRGMVLIRRYGEEEIEKFCVSVESDNVDDALDEARALAHKILNERMVYTQPDKDE